MDRRQDAVADGQAAGPAIRRLGLVTHDPVAAHAHLMRIYAGFTPAAAADSARRGTFRFESSLVTIGDLLSHHVRYGGDLSGTIDGRPTYGPPAHPGRVLAIHVLNGRLTFTIPPHGARVVVTAGQGCLLPLALIQQGATDAECFCVSLPVEALEDACRELPGGAVPLNLTALHLVAPAMATAWGATLRHVHYQAFVADSALALPLLLAQTRRQLAVTMLAAFPGVLTRPADPPATAPSPPLPRAVQLAVRYMESHAQSPITQRDVAAAAGIGVRALQLAFRRHLGTTPHEYLRKVRLERAHRELREPDGSTGSIADVAARWGFAHAGRFSRYHRELFGTSPRDVADPRRAG
jgi:AraC-like DNA-binding protein